MRYWMLEMKGWIGVMMVGGDGGWQDWLGRGMAGLNVWCLGYSQVIEGFEEARGMM